LTTSSPASSAPSRCGNQLSTILPPTFATPITIARAPDARACAGLKRGSSSVTVPSEQDHSPTQRSRAQSRRPKAVLAYVGSVTSPRNNRYGCGNCTFALPLDPGGTEQAPEIAAEDRADVLVGITAADQRFGQVERLARMIEAFDVDLVAEAVARLVRLLQLLVLIRRHVVVAVQVGVRADADVLDADQLHDVIDVIDDVLDRGRLLVLHEHAHAGDAHHAALHRELADRLVGLEPRMIVERAAVRMRDRDRLRRQLDGIQRRAVAAMRNVDQHAHL